MSQSSIHSPRQTKSKRQTIYFVLFVVIWAGLSLVASQFLTALILSILIGEQLTQPFWMFIFYLISYGLTLFMVLFATPRLFKKYAALLTVDRTQLGLTGSPTLTDIGLAPIGYVVYAVIANALVTFLSHFAWFDANESQDVGFYYFLSSSDRIFALISIVLIAPIAEEILMRGWLYGKLRNRLGVALSILLTSVLFALLHGQLNVGVTVFVLSVVLCLLREITGNIWSSLLLHIITNGISFYLLYVVQIV